MHRSQRRRCWSCYALGFCFWLLLAATAASVKAATIEAPLTTDYLVLDAALRERFYTGVGGRAEFWQGASNCGHLYATDPRLSSRDPKLRLESAADLQAALGIGEQCLTVLSWTGKLAADTTPQIQGWLLKFHVDDLEFLNADGSTIGGGAFGMVKGPLLSQLQSFSYSLAPDVARLKQIAGSATDPATATELRPILDSITLEPNVVILPDGLKFMLRLDLPQSLVLASSPGPLTAAQRTAWRIALSNAAEFLQAVGREIQPMIIDPQIDRQLTDILNTVRARLNAAVDSPPPGGDPLPLVRDQWTRLKTLAVSSAHQGLFGTHTVDALEAVTAADVVFALDQQAPALGRLLASAGLNVLANQAPQVSAPPVQR